MGLADRIRTFAAAALSAALVTCTSCATKTDSPIPPPEARKRVGSQQVEGDVLDFAVRRSFYHQGRFSYNLAGPRETNASFFLTQVDDCYVGVVHLANDPYEVDITIGERNAFPSTSPGSCLNLVHYCEAGECLRLRPEWDGSGQFPSIRGGAPAGLEDDSSRLVFVEFLGIYNQAVRELRVEERILTEYRSWRRGE